MVSAFKVYVFFRVAYNLFYRRMYQQPQVFIVFVFEITFRTTVEDIEGIIFINDINGPSQSFFEIFSSLIAPCKSENIITKFMCGLS